MTITKATKLEQDRQPCIIIKNMHKWYGDFHVLKNINLDVSKGEKNRYLWSLRFWQVNYDSVHQPVGRTSGRSNHC